MFLYTSTFETHLGLMTAVADDNQLYRLDFVLKTKSNKTLSFHNKPLTIVDAPSKPIILIKEELSKYFDGSLTQFKTPIYWSGTEFQTKVWLQLLTIPYGQTRSYAQQAQEMGAPRAFRAVANANGANCLAIVVPCHRVVASDGGLGGYNADLSIKRWLIEHEKRFSLTPSDFR